MRAPFITTTILLLPILEIAGFIVVGQQIGVLATLSLILVTSLAGIVLLRVQGFGILRRLNDETRAGRDPARDMVHGVMVVIAGLLLLLPGFITDAIGLLLFLPPVRDFVWRHFRQSITVYSSSTASFRTSGGNGDRGPVVDLDDDEFERKSDDGSSPWSKNPRIEN